MGDAFSDEESGGGEPVEELLLAIRSGCCAADGLAQLLTCRALAAMALGLVAFGAGGPLRGGAVPGGDLLEAEFGFDPAAFGLGAFAWLCPLVSLAREAKGSIVHADNRGVP